MTLTSANFVIKSSKNHNRLEVIQEYITKASLINTIKKWKKETKESLSAKITKEIRQISKLKQALVITTKKSNLQSLKEIKRPNENNVMYTLLF